MPAHVWRPVPRGAFAIVAAAAAVLASGCLAPAVAAPVDAAGPADALLVRVFFDDLDADGRPEVHIRLGALAGTRVVAFDGDVEVVLMPQGVHSNWRPLSWKGDVAASDFTDAVLPYFEIVQAAPHAEAGDAVEVVAEARLGDGSLVRGTHRTVL